MNAPSRRAAALLAPLALLVTALGSGPAHAQMIGGSGPGVRGGRPQGAPLHGGAGPAMAPPQFAAPSGPPPGAGGGLPMRTIGPSPGFSNNFAPLHGGAAYGPGAAMPYSPGGPVMPFAPAYGPADNGQGYARQGYARQGYARQGYARQGYARQPFSERPVRGGSDRRIVTLPSHGGVDLTPPPPVQNPTVPIGNGFYNTFNGGGYVYAPVVAIGGPALLGGYYYGNYCDTYYGPQTLPTVYSIYDGFPQYIYSGPGVTITTYANTGVLPVYVDPPQAFQSPQYTVNYNQNNYYVTSDGKAADLEAGGARAKAALPQAFPADSYQAALADIERAWTDGDLTLLTNHFHSDDTKISVLLRDKYKYSLASSDFGQITRDAFDRLDTHSFKFTEVRKAKNGDVTGFGKHVYTVADSGKAATGDLTPFDSSAPATDAPGASGGGAGTQKTVYVSYTLRHGDGTWYIVGINSSPDPLAKQ